MRRNVFTKALWDNRRAWLGWTAALAAIGAMYASFWPSIGGNPDMAKAMESYPAALKEALNLDDYTNPANYLASAVFGLLIPILLASMAISAGTKAIAGDEESGTLDLVMAHPVGRARLALSRIAAIAIGILVVGAGIGLVVAALRGPADFTAVPAGHIYAIALQLALFGLCFAAISFAAGAATGRRSIAIGAGAAVAVLGYLADSFLKQIDSLKWMEGLSPFHWYLGGEPLKNGLDWGGAGLLVGLSAVLIGLGTWAFTRRDLAV